MDVGRRAVLGSALGTVLAGCGGTRPRSGVAPATGTSARTPLPPSGGSPFTGLPSDPTAPVLSVKIDNVVQARPQTGTTAADLVYVQPVEGGLTRLLALFHSRVPPVVGPVRSVRETDLQVLACLGAPAMAFSGEAPELRPRLGRAPVVDVSQPAIPSAYFRDPARRAPHDLYVRADTLRAGRPPRDIGFRFGPVPRGGRAVGRVAARFATTVLNVTWDVDARRWIFGADGTPLLATEGGRPGAATVVLQRVPVRDTAILDVTGAPSPYAETVGAGEAILLRDGQSFAAAWSRPSADAPTTYTRPDGEPLTFAIGPVWVVLLPA